MGFSCAFYLFVCVLHCLFACIFLIWYYAFLSIQPYPAAVYCTMLLLLCSVLWTPLWCMAPVGCSMEGEPWTLLPYWTCYLTRCFYLTSCFYCSMIYLLSKLGPGWVLCALTWANPLMIEAFGPIFMQHWFGGQTFLALAWGINTVRGQKYICTFVLLFSPLLFSSNFSFSFSFWRSRFHLGLSLLRSLGAHAGQ